MRINGFKKMGRKKKNQNEDKISEDLKKEKKLFLEVCGVFTRDRNQSVFKTLHQEPSTRWTLEYN